MNAQTKSRPSIADKLMYIVAFAYPLTTIPQIIIIFSNHSSRNISLVTWSSSAACSLVSLIYALSHQLKPLIIEGILWTVMYAAVIIGILIYR